MITTRSLKFLLIILIPLVIILGNFNFLIFNKNFYQIFYQKSGTYQNFENQKIVDDATNNLFGFFKNKNKLDSTFFSSQAILHLTDVKNLTAQSVTLFYLSAVLVIIISVFLFVKKQTKILSESFFIGSITTIIFIVLLGAGTLTMFDQFFVKFHQLLFTNNLWLFTADDNLIKLFPQKFFVEFANRLALNIFISSTIIVGLSLIFKKSKR